MSVAGASGTTYVTAAGDFFNQAFRTVQQVLTNFRGAVTSLPKEDKKGLSVEKIQRWAPTILMAVAGFYSLYNHTLALVAGIGFGFYQNQDKEWPSTLAAIVKTYVPAAQYEQLEKIAALVVKVNPYLACATVAIFSRWLTEQGAAFYIGTLIAEGISGAAPPKGKTEGEPLLKDKVEGASAPQPPAEPAK